MHKIFVLFGAECLGNSLESLSHFLILPHCLHRFRSLCQEVHRRGRHALLDGTRAAEW